MPSRNEAARRARARLDLESMPVSDEASLRKLQEQAEGYLREAKRRNPSEADELVSMVTSSGNHGVEGTRRRTLRGHVRSLGDVG